LEEVKRLPPLGNDGVISRAVRVHYFFMVEKTYEREKNAKEETTMTYRISWVYRSHMRSSFPHFFGAFFGSLPLKTRSDVEILS
jgi:hypothetical protein